MNTTLIIMAAGIGSRYGGGIKQLAKVGPSDEIILDYSIHDALEAGFNDVIFIIRRDIEKDFREVIGDRMEKVCPCAYVFQDIHDLPRHMVMPEGRTKPWGTGHAILACKGTLKNPGCIINADDYYGKEAFVQMHDFIVNNVTYDKLKKEYSHEIIGALGNGVAVCEGIAKAVKILCDELNLWCIIALSEANPDKGIKYRHAWNVIQIGGQHYHLDATFDNTLSRDDTVRYDYVNLSDKQIFRDHEPVIWKVPTCSDGDHFYYKEKKISWTTVEEVQKRTKQAAKKGKVLLFHWRGGYLTREVLAELLEVFHEEAKAKDRRACVSVNWPQAVLRVRFEDGVGEEQIEMEEANEGERTHV